MAELILLVAIDSDGNKSQPIKVYDRFSKKLPKQFVVRVDSAEQSDSGEARLRVGNFELGLVGTHNADYLTGIIAGFRRVMGDDTFLLVSRFSEEIATAKDVSKIKSS